MTPKSNLLFVIPEIGRKSDGSLNPCYYVATNLLRLVAFFTQNIQIYWIDRHGKMHACTQNLGSFHTFKENL